MRALGGGPPMAVEKKRFTFRDPPYAYAAEKFVDAGIALKSKDPLRQRIFDAMTYLGRISPNDLPAGKIRDELMAIKAQLQGKWDAALEEMSHEELVAFVARLLELCEWAPRSLMPRE